MINVMTKSFFVIVAVLVISSIPVDAIAEDILWSHQVKLSKGRLTDYVVIPGDAKWSRFSMSHPHIQIQYHTKATNETTGKLLKCDGSDTVNVGDSIKYEFVPHVYKDIYWFTSGGTFDSPYGTWINGAAKPFSNMCSNLDQKDSAATYKSGGDATTGPSTRTLYVTLSVNPPAKSLGDISGLNCDAAASDGSRTCKASAVGQGGATFNFGATTGKFYGRSVGVKGARHSQCSTSNAAMVEYWHKGDSLYNNSYTLQIPAQKADCPFVIEGIPETGTPTTPTLTAGAACAVGTAHSITMTASDPDGDKVKYLVDWNNDGAVDVTVPSSGYVDSGTAQGASRTYGTPGSKTIRVRTEDEKGARSGWQSLTFSCAGEPDSSIVDLLGEDGAELGDGVGAEPTPSINDLSLRALPSLVRTGGTTKVHWSSQNMASCSVAGSNGDNWSGLNSPVSGEVSGAINGLVTYTLTCNAGGNSFTKKATVNVLPSWVEK
jgi:hypothetical protein